MHFFKCDDHGLLSFSVRAQRPAGSPGPQQERSYDVSLPAPV